MWRDAQGWSLNEDAEFGEEAVGLPGVFSEHGCHVCSSPSVHHVDDGIADADEGVGSSAGADAAAIFVERHVSHSEGAVFDRPAATQPTQQVCGVRTPAVDAGDGVAHRAVRLTATQRDPFQTQHLGGSWPGEMLAGAGGRAQAASFHAASAFAAGLSGSQISLPEPFLVGGKSLPARRRLARIPAAEPAGCP